MNRIQVLLLESWKKLDKIGFRLCNMCEIDGLYYSIAEKNCVPRLNALKPYFKFLIAQQ